MRGKVALPAKPPELFGITPACAGKSITPSGATNRNEDHPRVCGEKDRAHRHLHDALGSPPRVRGKGGRGAGIRTGAGITPACAGKRSNSAAMRSRSEDHPRVCGEKNPMQMIAQFRQGSPPRVRGKAAGWRQLHTGQRITPACAGKSVSYRSYQTSRQDHPRVCGEKI